MTGDADLTVLRANSNISQYKMLASFHNKTVWITGASSGLGRALALNLCQYNPKLVVSARRKEELDKLKKECLALNSYLTADDVMVLAMDCLEFEKFPVLVQAITEKFGQIDYLVNNAGRSQRSLAEDTPIAVDKALIELNVLGYIALTKAVLPGMIERKEGCIVAVSSLAGKLGAPISSGYSASKFALQGFYNALRAEVFQYNIDVCTVCPGPVQSDISKNAFTSDMKKKYSQDANLGKKQDVHRFAQLMAVSISSRIPEAWISIQPFLFYTYLYQYFPTLVTSRFFLRKMKTRIDLFKEDKSIY